MYLTSEWGKPARQTISVTIKCCICPGDCIWLLPLVWRGDILKSPITAAQAISNREAMHELIPVPLSQTRAPDAHSTFIPTRNNVRPLEESVCSFREQTALCVAVPGSISWQWKIPTPVNCKLLLRFNDNNKNAKKPLDFENVSVQLGFGILELFDELQWVNTEIF